MKHFTLDELTRSATARRLGIDNTPTRQAAVNLERLVDNLLDPLREAYGAPIYVNSGYRCPALNRAVGARPAASTSPAKPPTSRQAARLATAACMNCSGNCACP